MKKCNLLSLEMLKCYHPLSGKWKELHPSEITYIEGRGRVNSPQDFPLVVFTKESFLYLEVENFKILHFGEIVRTLDFESILNSLLDVNNPFWELRRIDVCLRSFEVILRGGETKDKNLKINFIRTEHFLHLSFELKFPKFLVARIEYQKITSRFVLNGMLSHFILSCLTPSQIRSHQKIEMDILRKKIEKREHIKFFSPLLWTMTSSHRKIFEKIKIIHRRFEERKGEYLRFILGVILNS